MNEIFPLKKYWNNACFHSSFLWLKLSRKFIVQNVIQNSQKALILYFLMCKFKLFYWKVRDLASLQALFLKKKIFYSNLSFSIRFPPSMSQAAYGSGWGKCKSTQKPHDPDMVMTWSCDICRFHRPDIDFWWHQQWWQKMWSFRFTCKRVSC